MKKKYLTLAVIPALLLSMASCGANNQEASASNNNQVASTTSNQVVATSSSSNATQSSVVTPSATSITPSGTVNESTLSYTVTKGEQSAISFADNTYTITGAGTFTFTGTSANAAIVVNAADCDVVIELNGVNITNSGSVISVTKANSLEVSAKSDTLNYLTDTSTTEAASKTPDATIYAKCDTKLKGSGSLVLSSTKNKGIHITKGLKIQKETLVVNSYDTAVKGDDSVTVYSGNLSLTSLTGDGLKSANTDVSSKGNQRGNVLISGGNVVINAKDDGIDAAYDFELSFDSENATEAPNVTVNSGSKASVSTSTLYLYASNTSYVYAAYFYDGSGNGEWVKFENVSGYYYSLSMPSTSYKNVAFYAFQSGTTSFSSDNYVAATSGGTVNTTKNMYRLRSVNTSSKSLSGDWTTYNSTTTSESSSKGIVSNNNIRINAGTLVVNAEDDGVHSNYGETLENGSVGEGNITFNGGKTYITSGDDGVHADKTLSVIGGEIYVTTAYEGLEADTIDISGGYSDIYATDDGINASTTIKVSGGNTIVSVPTGDTDAIDSNGTYVQTGGYVLAKNAGSDTSGNMAAIDTDRGATISGGTFIALGAISTLTSSINYVKFGSSGGGMGGNMGRPGGMGFNPGGQSSSTVTFAKGSYSISNTNISFELTTNYYGLLICSNELTVGSSYTLTGGTTKTWTQSSKQTTITS